ncbi:MAG: hypothetical protein GY725_24875 [bacterium]|nr:hypothetical protein [bacterium]
MNGSSRTIRGLATLFALTVLVFIAGCSSLGYRATQDKFVRAVELDNAAAVSPTSDSAADILYQELYEQLSKETIAKLDSRLRPNAYLIRAYSALGATELEGNLGKASDAARAGINAGAIEGSRDRVLLELLDGLVIYEELRANAAKDGLQQLGGITGDRYDLAYRNAFETARAQYEDALGQARRNTPASTIEYVHYRSWQLLVMWRATIALINNPDARLAANNDASRIVDKPSLKEAANEHRNAIPAGAPLRALIDAQTRG